MRLVEDFEVADARKKELARFSKDTPCVFRFARFLASSQTTFTA